MFLYVLLTLAVLKTSTATSLVCLYCTDAVSPADCDTVIKCGPHESCYVDTLVKASGSIRYKLGCRDENQCNRSLNNGRREVMHNSYNTLAGEFDAMLITDKALSQTRTPTRSNSSPNVFKTRGVSKRTNGLLICSECCKGNLCSNTGCGNKGYISPRGPICYSCTQQISPDDCFKITLCSQGEVCMLKKTLSPMTNEVRYTTRCEREQSCNDEILHYKQLASLLIGKRGRRNSFEAGGSCVVQCCQTDMCNINCYKTSPSTTIAPVPTVTMTTPPTKGEVWFDGCDYQCTCDDAKRGFYNCTRRCPEFFNVPDGCVYVQDPNDPACCKVPHCSPTTPPLATNGITIIPPRTSTTQSYATATHTGGQNAFVGGNPQIDQCQDNISNCDLYTQSVCSGDYFRWAQDNCPRYCGFCVSLYTTAQPPCEDRLSNCDDFASSSCAGQYVDWALENCRKHCGYCDYKSQSLGFYGQCYYKGQTYKQGETWDDGCDYQCTCLDGSTGKYQCYNRCPVYYSLPSQCTLVKSETECCLQPVCDFNPKISTFETASPGKTTTGIDVCQYQGHQYYQGQTWQDGCKYTCTCTDVRNGTHKCQTLCPNYTAIPSFCHLEAKPEECCTKPVCEFKTLKGSFTGSGTISGHGVAVTPTAPPACIDVISDCNTYGTDACINFEPWARDNCRKTCNLCDKAPTPDPTNVCIYNGTAFHQDDSWKVGCDTTCTCEEAFYGYYRCVNSCPKYHNLSQDCKEVKKAGDCCTSVQCTGGVFPSSTRDLATIGGGLIKTPGSIKPTLPSGGNPQHRAGGTNFTTPSLTSFCIYKSKIYNQGDVWQDGCQANCTCEDARTGFYRCQDLCPVWNNLPAGCTLEKKPGECCSQPNCGGTLIQPGDNANTCYYGGKYYREGDQWKDECKYKCTCQDGKTGFYQCQTLCLQWTLPQSCHLDPPPAGKCCQVPVCPSYVQLQYPHGFVQE